MIAILLALCILLATALPTRASEPALRLDNAAPAVELRPGQHFTLTIAVFSASAQAETITLDQQIDPTRFDVLAIDAAGGTAETLPGRVRWSGTAWADHPTTIYVDLLVRSDAPPGVVALPVSGRTAAGAEAWASTTVRVCCYAWPPPARPVWRVYLGIVRRA